MDGSGNLFIADYGNHRIRKVIFTSPAAAAPAPAARVAEIRERIERLRSLLWVTYPVPSTDQSLLRIKANNIVERSDQFYFLSVDYQLLGLKTLRWAEFWLDAGEGELASEYVDRAWRYLKLSSALYQGSIEQLRSSIDISQDLFIILFAETGLSFTAGPFGVPGVVAADIFSGFIDYSIDRAVRDVPMDKAIRRQVTSFVVKQILKVPAINGAIGEPITQYVGRESGLYQGLEKLMGSPEVAKAITQGVALAAEDLAIEAAGVDATWLANRIVEGLGQTPISAESALGRIAFVSGRDGNWEIYVMNADGSTQTRLTNNSASDLGPSWSPDGTKIAFFSDRDGDYEIYVMNSDGSNVTQLTNVGQNLDLDWSPGSKIAFYSSRDGGGIFVMNADGSGLTRLTKSTGGNGQPSWSPDGTKIAFMSRRGGGKGNIWVMNVDGSGPTRLTNSPGEHHQPSWSPDGTKIAFFSDRDGNDEIYVMNADGSSQTRLTNNSGLDLLPSWSPDGTKIAFFSDRDGDYEIYVMNADGSNPVKLTNNLVAERSPSWSP